MRLTSPGRNLITVPYANSARFHFLPLLRRGGPTSRAHTADAVSDNQVAVAAIRNGGEVRNIAWRVLCSRIALEALDLVAPSLSTRSYSRLCDFSFQSHALRSAGGVRTSRDARIDNEHRVCCGCCTPK